MCSTACVTVSGLTLDTGRRGRATSSKGAVALRLVAHEEASCDGRSMVTGAPTPSSALRLASAMTRACEDDTARRTGSDLWRSSSVRAIQ